MMYWLFCDVSNKQLSLR